MTSNDDALPIDIRLIRFWSLVLDSNGNFGSAIPVSVGGSTQETVFACLSPSLINDLRQKNAGEIRTFQTVRHERTDNEIDLRAKLDR